MAYSFEFMMSLDLSMNSKREILENFEICKSFQMPVVKDSYLLGIVDLFDIFRAPSELIDLRGFIRTDFYVAGKDEGIFSFKLFKQDILPFVDEEGKYMGFSNKVTVKCYMPGEEYLKPVEMKLTEMVLREHPQDIDEGAFQRIGAAFDAVLEDNYEGVYVTIDKGRTLATNDKAVFMHNVEDVSQMEVRGEDLFKFNSEESWKKAHFKQYANIVQVMQERKEISLVRLTSNMFDLPQMKKEIISMQELAKKYKQQLDAMNQEQNVSESFICRSPEMKRIMRLVAQVARVDSTILLQGDSGVGKGMMSRKIHDNSLRKDGPFMTIDCATLPPNLLESELFGYEKGAFTGAERTGKIGLVELANNGTLFLDEVGELHFSLQAKLLRMLQERVIYRVGGKTPISIDVRIVAATNRNLEEMVAQKQFRRDLYYRLRVIPIVIPPLKQRHEDIRPLIDHFLKQYNEQYKLNKWLTAGVYRLLMNYDWPGNVRELEHTIEFIVVTTGEDMINADDLPEEIQQKTAQSVDLINNYANLTFRDARAAFEKKILLSVMERSSSTLDMANILGMDRSTIIRKLQRYKIKTNFRNEENT